MSFLALGLTVCTAFACNTYHVDTADTVRECNTMYVAKSTEFIRVWNDTSSPLPLKEWFAKQNIGEEPAEVVSYRFECLTMEEEDAP